MAIWPEMEKSNSIFQTELKSWRDFHDVVQRTLASDSYVFRGQRRSDWALESSLARLFKDTEKDVSSLTEHHLDSFKLASRGRRGANPPQLLSEDDWWALGQHHGLATPLLDWTLSPYVALFFAFADASDYEQTKFCSVFVANKKRIEAKNAELVANDEKFPQKFEFFQPYSDDNSRLVAQSGLFSRVPIGIDIEGWITKYIDPKSPSITLLKILIPCSDRKECLKALHVMNLNHATLFPDLYGAGKQSTELLRRALG